MKSPKMISGDWQPTPDPTGRRVRFSRFGVVMEGTVVAVEFEEDRPPTLYVEVASPDEHRGEYGMSPKSITWLDDNQPPWSASKTPSGRWVIYHDEEGIERSGCVVSVDSRHRQDAVLTVLSLGPEYSGIHEVDWRSVNWLPA